MNPRRLSWLALIVSASLAAFLAISLGPSLFFAIPWPVRKGFGWAGFGLLMAALGRRLLRGPAFSPPDRVEVEEPSGWLARLGPALAGLLAVGLLAFPLLGHPENLGFDDWDLFLGKYEAARRTIADYGQFPWWDPWTRGGFPLASNPQCGVWGVAMPLCLAFGTSVGLRLATLACFGLAFEGARRLARLWRFEPVSAGFAGFAYALNGAVLVASVAAYHVSMCYPCLPWMLYFAFKLDRKPIDGAWLGAWAAFSLLNGIQYFTVYTALIVGVVWIRRAATLDRPARARLVAHSAVALGVFLGLSGWRLATTTLVYRDFPRVYASGWAEGPLSILRNLLGRPPASVLASNHVSEFWESTCYVGPLLLALGAISLRGGFRWWHWLALVCGCLAAGSADWPYPSYWLAHFPAFSTMHAVPRWRFMALLGLSLAAASVVDAWRRDPRKSRRLLANLAVGLVAADYLSYGFQVLPVAFSVEPAEARFPGPALPVGTVRQVDEAPGFAATLRGHGVIHGFEPLMGYNRQAPTARTYEGAPGYVAEVWTDRGPAEVVSWSPNRIEVRARPGEEVSINQNPGSWWLVNGIKPFGADRCAEMNKPFKVRADDAGRLVLAIEPKGLRVGLWLHAVGAALATVGWATSRSFRPRPGEAGSPACR